MITQKRANILRAIERLTVSKGKSPTVAEVAVDLGLPVSTIYNLVSSMEYVGLASVVLGPRVLRVTRAGERALAELPPRSKPKEAQND